MITIDEAREAIKGMYGPGTDEFTLSFAGIHPWGGSIFIVTVEWDEDDKSEDRVRVYRNDAGALMVEDTNL